MEDGKFNNLFDFLKIDNKNYQLKITSDFIKPKRQINK
jgi:hypothetical protein